jgi:hypothetical protein
MKQLLTVLTLSLIAISCQESDAPIKHQEVDWSDREISINESERDLYEGGSYLSVYSQIYNQTGKNTTNLTATVSLRNINTTDTIYIQNAEYFDTNGKSIRKYISESIFISPMETLEIIIDRKDVAGGTGANFHFDWMIPKGANPPLFEALMISTSGKQGISFITTGVLVN